MTNRQIAQDAALAEKTVKNYVSSMLGKLDMGSRTQAALFAAKRERRRPQVLGPEAVPDQWHCRRPAAAVQHGPQ